MCIILAANLNGQVCLGKNRDRAYAPKIRVCRFLAPSGVEVFMVLDAVTGWLEGMNSLGIGVVNSALMVQRDEAEKKLVKRGKRSKDGRRILEALCKTTLDDAVASLAHFNGGIKGHTFVCDGKRLVTLEQTTKHKPHVAELSMDGVHVRTNHGLYYPDAGYQDGENLLSSRLRYDQATKVLRHAKDPEDVMPLLRTTVLPLDSPYNMVRDTPKMKTSSQLTLNLTKRHAHLYILPGKAELLEERVKFPKGYKAQIAYDVIGD